MLRFHEVVIYCDVTRLIYIVEQVALYNVGCVVPLLRLANELTTLETIVHHFVVVATTVVSIDLIRNFGVQPRSTMQPVLVGCILWICRNKRRLFQGVRNGKPCNLCERFIRHRKEFVSYHQHRGFEHMCRKLRTLRNRLVEIDPSAPELFHLGT